MARLRLYTEVLPSDFKVAQAFSALADHPQTVFLDSSDASTARGRYSILATDPLSSLEPPGSWNALKTLWKPCPVVSEYPWPFRGGWIGYLAYEAYQYFIPKVPKRKTSYPVFYFPFYDTFIMTDHQTGKSYLASLGLDGLKGSSDKGRAEQKMAHLYERIRYMQQDKEIGATKLFPTITKQQYCDKVQKIKELIAAGDCYQVNYAQCFEGKTTASPASLYRRLRCFNPATHAAFLNCGSFQILSSSPESFLEIAGNQITTQPIKGTRPRNIDDKIDKRFRKELWSSKKDRAELLMITDLERNDLGRVCLPGSVTTKELTGLLQLPHLYHLYSVISGRLEPDKTVGDVLNACFPGGSITGAPKIRAMQIIRELEDHPREIYTGSIGSISIDGSVQMNIAIRTMTHEAGEIKIYAGGGIVTDSDPEQEYEECLVKLKGMQAALHATGPVTAKTFRQGLPHKGAARRKASPRHPSQIIAK